MIMCINHPLLQLDKFCHVFAIAAGDIIKYQGGHMMRNADARAVHSRHETFNSNGGHDA